MPYEPIPFDQTPAWLVADRTREAKVGSWDCAVRPSVLRSDGTIVLSRVTSLTSAPQFQFGFQHIDEHLNAILACEWPVQAAGKCRIEYSLDDEPVRKLYGVFLGDGARVGLGHENSVILARDLVGRQRLGMRLHLSAFDLLDSLYDVRGFADAHALALRRFVLAPSYISPARRWGLLT